MSDCEKQTLWQSTRFFIHHTFKRLNNIFWPNSTYGRADCDGQWSLLCSPALWSDKHQLFPSVRSWRLLPACRSPHRSPDWSNRPWTLRPAGHRCGPEIGQTPSDIIMRINQSQHRDGGGPTACREKMKTWRVEGQTDWQTDRHSWMFRQSWHTELYRQLWWTCEDPHTGNLSHMHVSVWDNIYSYVWKCIMV